MMSGLLHGLGLRDNEHAGRLADEPMTMRGFKEWRNESDLARFRKLQFDAYVARTEFLMTRPRSQRSKWPAWVRELWRNRW